MTDRTPPHNLEAEQAILGAMLISRPAVRDAQDHLAGADFYRAIHEMIFDAVCALESRTEPTDAIATASELTRRGQLDQVGGHAYLADLVGAASITSNVTYLAEIILDAATSRRIIDGAQRAVQLGYDQTSPAIDRLDTVRGLFEHAAHATSTAVTFDGLMDGVLDVLDQGRSAALPTPWPDLNHLIYGLERGRLYVVGARPGIGKSLFSQAVATHASSLGVASYYASLEMTAHELTLRALASESGVNLASLSRGGLIEEEWRRVSPASQTLRTSRIHIVDHEQSMADIRSGARTVARQHTLGLIVIDYAQLVTPRDRRLGREAQVAEISRDAKLMAKALDVPVVLLAQVNRGPESRVDKTPTMSDLRESGALEADADVVILLHPEDGATLKVIVAKNRSGRTDSIHLRRLGAFAQLRSATKEEQ